MESLVKTCNYCDEEKLMSEFHRQEAAKDGHNYQCKLCYNNYMRLRRANNVSVRVNNQLLAQMRHLIRGTTPSHKLLKIMNCNKMFFFKWLEFQFEDNMTWSNYGKIWNIDHVIPASSFNLLNEDELKRCYSWTNLRPCTIEENREKGSKIDYGFITIQKKQAHIFKNIYEEII